MISMITDFGDDGVAFFVNVGEKTVWSKFCAWEAKQAHRDRLERIQKRIAAGYLAETVRRDIAKLRDMEPRPAFVKRKVKMPRPLRRAI